MTPEAQRIAIAEECGFANIRHIGYVYGGKTLVGELNRSEFSVPNYLNDLNAMHGAERVLDGVQFRQYTRYLMEIAQPYPVIATAAQRAEAFLRTLGKWDDTK